MIKELGSIKISTVPSEARIFLGYKELGKTPINITDVETGNYKCTLVSKDYEEVIFNINLLKNQTMDIIVDLKTGKLERKLSSLDTKSEFNDKSLEEQSSINLTNLNLIIDKLEEISKNLSKKDDVKKIDSGLQTIATAVTTVLAYDNVSATGYTRIGIYDNIARPSKELYFLNQGPGTIYARKSENGIQFSTNEIPIYAGQRKVFSNVYELRIRATEDDTNYIYTEHQTDLMINNFDDRSATAQHINYVANGVAPHALVTRASYTVPTGFRAKVHGCYTFVQLATVGASPGLRQAIILIGSPGSLFAVISSSIGADQNTVGNLKENQVGLSYTLLTGESIAIQTRDSSGNGTVNYVSSAAITQYFSFPT